MDRGGRLSRWNTVSVHLSLGTFAGNMAGLTTSVAGFASSVERSAVGRSTIPRDMAYGNISGQWNDGYCIHTELSTSIALHGLRLAVPSEVVRATTLVAGSRASSTSKTAPEVSSETTSRSASSTANSSSTGVGAIASQMSSHSTAVASPACARTAQAQGRAVGLNMTETLAVITLLSCKQVSICIYSNSTTVWSDRGGGLRKMTKHTFSGARMGASV